MSQNSLTLPTTGTVSGLQMTQNINNALDTLNSLASGASAPGSPVAGQLWHDTTSNMLKLRSLDNTAWIALIALNESSYLSSHAYPSQITGLVNKIINSAMVVDQVNEGGAYALSNGIAAYTVDQWIASYTNSSASGVSVQRVTDAPAGFTHSLKVTVGIGASSVSSSDNFFFAQYIEGHNISDLGYGGSSAAPLSLSFWVKSSVSGTFAVTLANASANRSIVKSFSIASTGTWTQITIPNIPGDITGTWGSGTSIGIILNITIAAGSSYQTATLGSWQGIFYLASTSQTNNVLTTTGATFQITGVMLNPGVFCLPYEKQPIHRELEACERYYEKSFPQGTAVAQNAGTAGAYTIVCSSSSFGNAVMFRRPKRAAVTIVTYNPSNTNANWRDTSNSADRTFTGGSPSDKLFQCLGSGGVTNASALIHYTANARM